MKQQGFTIAEVLVALLILSTILLTVTPMQVASLRRIVEGAGDLDRLHLLRSELAKLRSMPPTTLKTSTTTHEKPEMIITKAFQEISPKSTLASFADELIVARVAGSWHTAGHAAERSLALITLLPKPKEKR